MLARLEQDPGLGEGVDVVGDHRRRTVVDRIEQVTIRHQAQALVPRCVGRREVGIDVVVGPECFGDPLDQEVLRLVGVLAHPLVHHLLQQRVLGAGDAVGDPSGSTLRRRLAITSTSGPASDVRRRTLQHGHVGGRRRHRRHQRHRRRPGSDHHDALVGVVEVLRPRLGMHDLALETLPTLEPGV